MEDLDTPREVPGAADAILRQLEHHGLEWDEAPLYQSARLPAYADALDALRAAGRVYACDCSRKDLEGAYPGTCRDRRDVASPHAIRFRLTQSPLAFRDRWQGERRYEPARLGDPVVRRRDGLFAYQLAVVVDDAHQRITDVVRGADLVDSTPWQIALFEALGRHVATLCPFTGGDRTRRAQAREVPTLARPRFQRRWRKPPRGAPPARAVTATRIGARRSARDSFVGAHELESASLGKPCRNCGARNVWVRRPACNKVVEHPAFA